MVQKMLRVNPAKTTIVETLKIFACRVEMFIILHSRAMKTKGMVFRYTWVYSKEDTMAHTRRPWSLVNCWREALTRHYIRCS